MEHRAAHGALHHAHLHHRGVPQPRLPTFSEEQMPSLVQRSSTTDEPTPAQTQNQGNIVIGLAAAIPITVAMIVLFFLHRRIKRRMRNEDRDDKHRSLDFGMDEVMPGRGRKGPEMSVDPAYRRNRGMSLDMDLANPYLLPTAVNSSKDSLHSLAMSRTHSDPNDPYRPVTLLTDRERSPSRLRHDRKADYDPYNEKQDSHRASLLHNAAHMPQNDTPDLAQNPYGFDEKARNLPEIPPPHKNSLPPPPPQKQDRWYPADDPRYGSESPPDISGMAPQTPNDMLSHKTTLPAIPQAARKPLPPVAPPADEQYLYDEQTPQYSNGDALRINVPPPTYDGQGYSREPTPLPDLPAKDFEAEPAHEPSTGFQFELDPPPVPRHNSDPQEAHFPLPGGDDRRVSMIGMRPLPPDDPSDNPEQRANRIRSFYREYFDDSKPNPPGHYPVPDPYGYGEQDEYYGDALDDGMVYDPATGAFYYSQPQQPYAQPINRRAMTPPPGGFREMMGGHRSAMSTQSAGRRALPPKKRLPPPKPLMTIPTPHLLRDDSSLTDFAPRTTFRDRQLGRAPDSPLGTVRPFQPAFRPHTPLATSYDDMLMLPNPHALRKSGTFTGLDFAPPPKFRDRGETMSETGSIKSNRSGMSALQRDAIRAGAYRVSRLPKEFVGTQQDLAVSLKPNWDMTR